MRHPNRAPFEGVLTVVDSPSDKAPSGAEGHRVIVPRAVAQKALRGLVGMGVNYRPRWDGHDCQMKIGVITCAKIINDQVHIRGHLYGRDFPEVVEELLSRDDLGMSYELTDSHVENTRANVWTLTRITFCGAAILQRTKAAYKTTNFRLARPRRANRPGVRIEAGACEHRKVHHWTCEDVRRCMDCDCTDPDQLGMQSGRVVVISSAEFDFKPVAPARMEYVQ